LSLSRGAGRTAAIGLGAAGLVLALSACSAAGTTAEQTTSGSPSATPSSAGEGRHVAGMPEWQPRPGLNVPRDDFASAVVGKQIWVLGGMTGDRGTRLRSIEVYDTRTDRWRMSDVTMPVGVASFEGTAIGDKVYVFGGLDHNSRPTDFSAVLDTATGKWRRLPPLPTPRYAHTVTLHDGRIYVIGGEGAKGAVGEVDVFDPRTERWTTGTPMPQARGSHDAVSAGDLIYVVGGWLDGGPSTLVQTYDPVKGRWDEAAPLPEPVSRAGVAVLDGRIWVSFHQFSAVMDLGTGTWSRANPLTKSRHGLGYLPVGGSLFAVGGCAEYPLRDLRNVDELRVR
jgi:hypothetical protein